MSTSSPALATTDGRSRPRPGVAVRAGQIILTIVFLVCGLVAISTMFADDPFAPDALVLIASFGTLAATLGLVAVWGGVGSRTIRIGLWALPLFFVWHIAALGTWIPDAVFAVLASTGVILLSAQRRAR